MTKVLSNTFKTTVHIVGKFAICLPMVIFYSPSTMANSGLNFNQRSVEEELKLDSARACKDYQTQIDRAGSDMDLACKKAGYGTADSCISKTFSCKENASEESFDTMESIATALGVQYASTSKKPNSSCPTLNDKDYKSTKESAEKRLKEAQKELAELKDKQADNQKDYDKTITELMEAISTANEELTEAKSKLDEEQRNKISEFQNSQKEAARTIRDNESKLIDLRSQLTAALREKTNALSQLTASTSKFNCTTEYNKVIKENSTKSSGSGSYINRSKSIKAAAIDAFNKCMDRFNLARTQANDKFKSTSEALNKQIANVEADNADLEDNLKLANSQLTEIKTDVLNRKTAAEKKVSDLLTRTQSQMESAKTELQTRLQGIQQQTQALNKEINDINNSLAKMVAPPSGAEYSIAQANSEIDAKASEVKNLMASCESTGCTCSSQALNSYNNSKSSSGSKKTNSQRPATRKNSGSSETKASQ